MSRYIFTTFLTIYCGLFLNAQSSETQVNALYFISAQQGAFEGQQVDVASLKISSSHVSSISGIRHIYYQQTIDEINLLNQMASVHLDNENQVIHSTNKLIDLSTFQTSKTRNIDAAHALSSAATHYDLPIIGQTKLIEESNNPDQKHIFSNTGWSSYPIESRLVYIVDQNRIKLTWEVILDLDSQHEKWAAYVDADTGSIIKETPLFLNCDFGKPDDSDIVSNHHPSHSDISSASLEEMFMNNSYNVYAIPIEAPNEGPRSIVVEPWLAGAPASPFGWHDTDGVDGAEFTITQGNNIHAVDDLDGNSVGGDSPDGGPALNFVDFPLDESMEPITYLEAATVNLFYTTNIMHDVSWNYGFDTAAGNFQLNNYGPTEGIGGDPIRAEAQDGSDTNNARFFLSTDGGQSRIEMYEFVPSSGSAVVEVTAPANVIGFYSGAKASFGPQIATVSGEVILTEPLEACTSITNGAAIAGKIALIDRGDCNFTVKVKGAQDVGAIATIICNNIPGDGVFSMGGSDPTITIPSAMISFEDCQTIRVESGNGLNVNLNLIDQVNTDGDLDNGIIAHEYAHGISSRLSGGANTIGCLQGNEQMGEGWSDYFALMLQMKSTDDPADPNGMGTYVGGETSTGNGIRVFPYSTDFNVNPLTYDDIGGLPVPHGVGTVWATMLWDMTWNLVEKHGFDADIYSTNGGNGIALQLVMEGLKLQVCSPGFVEGRDAILAADVALFGGENSCEIWRAFARRGLGVSADQGSSGSNTDGTEAFDRPPGCPDELIKPCDDVNITYDGVSIPDGTDERAQTSVTIVDSDVLAGDNVMLRAGSRIEIDPLFEVAKTGELFLKMIPCDDSGLPFLSEDDKLKLFKSISKGSME